MTLAEESGGTLLGKEGECVELLQECASCTYVNLTTIQYPNMSKQNIHLPMTKNGMSYNISFCSTQESGCFVYCFVGDVDATPTISCKDFNITPNGKEKPSGIVVVFFSILFLIFVCGLISLLIYNIAHMVQWDFDMRDLIYNISSYFGLFVTYIFAKEYMGNAFVEDFLVWLIGVAAVTNIILPMIAFIMSYVKGGLEGGNNGY